MDSLTPSRPAVKPDRPSALVIVEEVPSAAPVNHELQLRFAREVVPLVWRIGRKRTALLPEGLREELLANALALAWSRWARLAGQGRDAPALNIALWSVQDALRGGSVVRHGRTDVYRLAARHKLCLHHLDGLPVHEPADPRERPAQAAQVHLDLKAWVGTLSQRERLAVMLYRAGASVTDVARRLGIDPTNARRLQKKLRRRWESFTK